MYKYISIEPRVVPIRPNNDTWLGCHHEFIGQSTTTNGTKELVLMVFDDSQVQHMPVSPSSIHRTGVDVIHYWTITTYIVLENGIRLHFIGLNPHSNGLDFCQILTSDLKNHNFF